MSHLKNYGLRLIENNPNIVKSRIVGFLEKKFFDIKSIINLNLVDLNIYEYNVIRKVHAKDYSVKWHLENTQIKDKEFLSSKKSIDYKDNIPEYSMIVYESDYDVDFKGGILEFCDGFKVYPKKNMYVFFDSRLVHMVHKILDGVRVNYLIKFCKKKIN